MALSIPESTLLVKVLLETERVLNFSLAEFDLLVRQARRANLMGKLAAQLAHLGMLERIPVSPRQHFLSALKISRRQDLAIRHEISCISEALCRTGVQIILLKGAAYTLAGLPMSVGRSFSDVDVLVPKDRIIDVESALMIHGWQGGHHDEYDQRYYRQWMHEIPPMMHIGRGTTIDVHHSILPETARIKIATSVLFEDIRPVDGFKNVYVLNPINMVLHSAAHLFHEGELDNGLRDLFDLDSMFRTFGADEYFWRDLIPCAIRLGLQRPLFYAAHFSSRFLRTPFPDAWMDNLQSISPPRLTLGLMEFCYARALNPNHRSCDSTLTPWARRLLFVRSHWIKMPVLKLIRHLMHKMLLGKKQENPSTILQQEQA